MNACQLSLSIQCYAEQDSHNAQQFTARDVAKLQASIIQPWQKTNKPQNKIKQINFNPFKWCACSARKGDIEKCYSKCVEMDNSWNKECFLGIVQEINMANKTIG